MSDSGLAQKLEDERLAFVRQFVLNAVTAGATLSIAMALVVQRANAAWSAIEATRSAKP